MQAPCQPNAALAQVVADERRPRSVTDGRRCRRRSGPGPRVLIALNKPYGVVCRFGVEPGRPTLADFVPIPAVYPAGRLDTDSEGLVLLTDDGPLQARIADPQHKLEKVYLAQVEGEPTPAALEALRRGVDLGDFVTRPAEARLLEAPPDLWPRDPPIRYRAHIPTRWIALTLREGKNRQVRRMTARVGFPTLRLVRVRIGAVALDDLALGQWRAVPADAPWARRPRAGPGVRSGA